MCVPIDRLLVSKLAVVPKSPLMLDRHRYATTVPSASVPCPENAIGLPAAAFAGVIESI